MPPNLLAHYLYLAETTEVPQVIETTWVSASLGLSCWSQQRQLATRSCVFGVRIERDDGIRQAGREGFELDDDILTVFERFEVVWPLDVADTITGPPSQTH